MKNLRASSIPIFLAALIFFSGCATPKKKPAVQPKPTPTPVRESYWNGDGVEGSPKITINLNEQRAYFYIDGKLVGESSVSSGKKEFETPPGHYKVIQKDKDHVSNLYGDYVNKETGEVIKKNVDTSKDPMPEGAEFKGAKMPFFMRFRDGYGMHAGYVPRYRASHGCVRMPLAMAEHFFNAADNGTPVTVIDTEPAPSPSPAPAPAKKSPIVSFLTGDKHDETPARATH